MWNESHDSNGEKQEIQVRQLHSGDDAGPQSLDYSNSYTSSTLCKCSNYNRNWFMFFQAFFRKMISGKYISIGFKFKEFVSAKKSKNVLLAKIVDEWDEDLKDAVILMSKNITNADINKTEIFIVLGGIRQRCHREGIGQTRYKDRSITFDFCFVFSINTS